MTITYDTFQPSSVDRMRIYPAKVGIPIRMPLVQKQKCFCYPLMFLL